MRDIRIAYNYGEFNFEIFDNLIVSNNYEN